MAKSSNSCAACEIRLQFCIAGANEWAPNPFVVLLRNAQTDLAIRNWTILVPMRFKKIKTDLVFFVPIRVGLAFINTKKFTSFKI